MRVTNQRIIMIVVLFSCLLWLMQSCSTNNDDDEPDTPTPTPTVTPTPTATSTPTPGQSTFSLTFGGPDYDEGYSVHQTADGGFFVAGVTKSYGAGQTDVYAIRTDRWGNELWVWPQTYGGSEDEFCTSAQEVSDGFILCGSTNSYGNGDSDIYLVKIDDQGEQVWSRTYGGSDYEWGNSVQSTSDNGYILCGLTHSQSVGMSDIYLVKTDEQGYEQWSRVFGGAEAESGTSVQQTVDGGYIIGAVSYYFAGPEFRDIYVIKTDGQGHEEWTTVIDSASRENLYSIRQTQDGGYIICGDIWGYSNNLNDVFLIKLNEHGSLVWSQVYGGERYDWGWSAGETSDGGFIICGYTESYGNGDGDVYLIKTNSTGQQQWWRTYGGHLSEVGYSVKQTDDGGYILAGATATYGFGDFDVYLLKTDEEGRF